MASYPAQDTIRFRLAAFFFNQRADALRGEMYRALSLLALSTAARPLAIDDVTDAVLGMLGASQATRASLAAIVSEELRNLVQRGEVQLANGHFTPADSAVGPIGPSAEEAAVEKIRTEVEKMARSIAPGISEPQVDTLLEFFLEASAVIASSQIPLLVRGTSGLPPSPYLPDTVAEIRMRYGIDTFIDGDKFAIAMFVSPGEVVGDYLYRLYQVNIAISLLAWDPSLQYIQGEVLSRISIYLDTNILFAIVHQSHPLHYFICSLLQATKDDLGVRIRVHAATLREYESVLTYTDSQFASYQRTLAEVAKICMRDGSDPADYIEDSIFLDYLTKSPDHIDTGSWQRFLNGVMLPPLRQKLATMRIEVDEQSAFVPADQFEELKTCLRSASKAQVERGKRRDIKLDPSHDARIYHLISSTRKKRPDSRFSVGYDTYLLTLDGSLVYFLRDFGVPWTETYFFFPNQWYELAFPFLRMRYTNQVAFTAAVTSLAFSLAFPKLSPLIPLELCAYVFDLGGSALPMGSVHEVITAATEQRLLENLDPANKDRRKREEATLQVQRLIAHEEIKYRQSLEPMKREAERLKEEADQLRVDIRDLGAKKTTLDQRVREREKELKKLGRADAQIEAIRSVYSEEIEALKAAAARATAEKETALAAKDADLARRDEVQGALEEQLQEIEGTIARLQDAFAEETARRTELQVKAERESELRSLRAKKLSVSGLMILGTCISVLLLAHFNAGSAFMVGAGLFGLLGPALLWTHASPWIAFGLYAVGILISTVAILEVRDQSELLWLIPMAWQVGVFFLGRALNRRASD